MKIVNRVTGKIYYGTEGEKFFVVDSFWKALKAGKVKYRTGEGVGNDFYTVIEVLRVESIDFEAVFREIARSRVGMAVLGGDRLPTTIL